MRVLAIAILSALGACSSWRPIHSTTGPAGAAELRVHPERAVRVLLRDGRRVGFYSAMVGLDSIRGPALGPTGRPEAPIAVARGDIVQVEQLALDKRRTALWTLTVPPAAALTAALYFFLTFEGK